MRVIISLSVSLHLSVHAEGRNPSKREKEQTDQWIRRMLKHMAEV